MLDALEQALYARGPVGPNRLVHHSDRTVQLGSIRYTERLAQVGLEPSVGSVRDSYDNALAETINGLATLEWVDWFNHRRLLDPIGNIPPPEAEANYYLQSAESVEMT